MGRRGPQEAPVVGAGKPASHQHPVLPKGPGTVTSITLPLPGLAPGLWPVTLAQPRPLKAGGHEVTLHSQHHLAPARQPGARGDVALLRGHPWGRGEERGSLCFLQPVLLPGWGCCWTWLPGHRVLQGRVSSWRRSCSCSRWQGSGRGAQTSPKPQQGPDKNLAFQLLQLGVLLPPARSLPAPCPPPPD